MWWSARRVFSIAFVTDIAWKFPPWCTSPVSPSMSGLSVAVQIEPSQSVAEEHASATLTRVALNGDRGKRGQDVFYLRAQELCRSAQRVPVLAKLADVRGNVLLLLDRHRELRACKKIGDRCGDLDLSGVRACDRVDEGRK